MRNPLAVVAQAGHGRRVLFGQETADGAVEAHRQAVHVAGAAGMEELRELFTLVEHQVVMDAVDALRVEQAGNGSRIGPTKRNVGDPMRYPRAEVVRRRDVSQCATLHDDEVVGDTLHLLHLVGTIDDRTARHGVGMEQGLQEGAFGDDVQAERRLVEHEQFGALRQAERQVETRARSPRDSWLTFWLACTL